MGEMKPFSQACVNNRQPILDILKKAFVDCREVLEIGSGTGQHAVYFAPELSHLRWHPSDRRENLPGIHSWIEDQLFHNLNAPMELDVDRGWPRNTFDGFFTANTCHIMSWDSVVNMFAGIGETASSGAVMVIYGPFKYKGRFTTESNANFDQWLKSVLPHQGVRDIEDIIGLADNAGFSLAEDNAMPANNQLLIFRK